MFNPYKGGAVSNGSPTRSFTMHHIEISYKKSSKDLKAYISVGSTTFLLGVITLDREGLSDISNLAIDLLKCAEGTNNILSKVSAEILRTKK
jgi:hypothetical protein